MMNNEVGDEVLVRSTLRGDNEAFKALYERYKDKVFATAYRIIGLPEDATDMTQDIFVKAYTELPRFKFQSAFSTWLYRIAVNMSINRINETKRRDRILRQNQPGANVDRFAETRMNEKVQRAILGLSPPLRAVIVLRYLQNLSYEEIAQALEIPVGTVKSRLNLAHSNLRVLLKEAKNELFKVQ